MATVTSTTAKITTTEMAMMTTANLVRSKT